VNPRFLPILVWIAAAAVAPARAGAVDADGPRAVHPPEGSLEKLLREVRRRRAGSAAKLSGPVETLVSKLDAVPADDAAEAARIQQALIALGSEVAPLLVARLDPGAAAGGPEKRLAQRLVGVLVALPTRAITDALIAMAREGSKGGRVNALEVLGTSPDRAKASETLVDLFRHSSGELRSQAVRSLARLGGAENEAVLVDALKESDVEILRAVLAALTEVASPAGRARVRDLAGAPGVAAPLVGEILAYYRALANASSGGVDSDDVGALLRLAAHDAPQKADRLSVLDAIPAFHPGLDTKTKKLFEPLQNEADDELREAAEICLALLGDRNARRDVIKRYNDLVARNDTWAGAYEQRGAVLLKLAEYDGAAKDFRRAIKVYESQGRTNQLEDLYVLLARTYARDRNPKKAFDALEEGKLPRAVLKGLKSDPDFAEVAAHTRYGKIFDV
jgi:tetratricopeptide (TPR) repeat protein